MDPQSEVGTTHADSYDVCGTTEFTEEDLIAICSGDKAHTIININESNEHIEESDHDLATADNNGGDKDGTREKDSMVAPKCSTPSEIVLHDHNFTKTSKSPKLAALLTRPLPSNQSNNNKSDLTTIESLQLAPGTQILRILGNPLTTTDPNGKSTMSLTTLGSNISNQSIVLPQGFQLLNSIIPGWPTTDQTTSQDDLTSKTLPVNIFATTTAIPSFVPSVSPTTTINTSNITAITTQNKGNRRKTQQQVKVDSVEEEDEESGHVPEQEVEEGEISQFGGQNIFVQSSSLLNIQAQPEPGDDNPPQQLRFMYVAGLCRVCLLKKDHLMNIFEDVTIGLNGLIENARGPNAASRYNIIPALKTLLDIDVSYSDGLPQNICVDCFDSLMAFSVFRKKISLGQQKLNGIITQVQGTPNITLLNDIGEVDMKATKVFRHCDSIIKANELIKSSNFSHCVVRNLSERILDKMFTAMSTMVGFKSGKLKELDMYAIDIPYVTAWFCYTCNQTIHGSYKVFSHHFVEVHEIDDADDVLFPCDICGDSFSIVDSTGKSQNYSEHWLQHFFFHECNVCKKKMPSIKGMWVHKRSAHSTTDKIYQCNICHKSFYKKAHLEAHNKTHLDAEERKQHLNWCKVCGKGLTSSMATHMASVHSDERPWSCEICNKSFKRKEILNGHRATVHYNLKKYQCELCGVYLKSHSSKAVHLLRHKGQKNHACETCGKSFYSINSLRSHMVRHKEVGDNQCTTCGKAFKRKIYLAEHMRLHSGEKPWECHVCGKHIRMKSNFYKHMKIHKRRENELQNDDIEVKTVTLEIDLT